MKKKYPTFRYCLAGHVISNRRSLLVYRTTKTYILGFCKSCALKNNRNTTVILLKKKKKKKSNWIGGFGTM